MMPEENKVGDALSFCAFWKQVLITAQCLSYYFTLEERQQLQVYELLVGHNINLADYTICSYVICKQFKKDHQPCVPE